MNTFYFKKARRNPELPLSAVGQTTYQLSDAFRVEPCGLKVASFKDAQLLARQINAGRAEGHPEGLVRAGELYAAALVQEILRLMIADYLTKQHGVLERAYQALIAGVGRLGLERTLNHYVALFPPKLVRDGEVTPEAYLTGSFEGIDNHWVAFEGLILLHLANYNPAFLRLRDLFDDSPLGETPYHQVIAGLETFMDSEPDLGNTGQKLFPFIKGQLDASPDSIEEQLRRLRSNLAELGLDIAGLDELLLELGRALGTLEEEGRAVYDGPFIPGPMEAFDPGGSGGDWEEERFSPDSNWMPRVVMLAKSTFVWLDQLSKQYGRDIHRLDDIPDEELDELARRGFTGLWLIGLWQRSNASKTIKHLRGNPDAVASAYSLYDYVIADDLGGFEAYQRLKDRAWQRGIRMASDMVPNHVGIDGKWVLEHPDWFLQLDHAPYPGYTFNGPDLSQDEHVGIFIEDHYYDATDAAVVFKRVDRHSGHERYIYHGNDGTTMPWNDTAQINYLNAEAREAVIQTILHVARLSPIIRFDAAMTLAKRHIQRLWFPEPGVGGAIASRSQYGTMRREDFDAAIPVEFWREVVDRVALEVPDTLLLAEAFWMLEGYFVRTLGMHRVYNSAFMHMFKNEDNAKYRLSIKNTLEFEPEILKRFVNFMNNPDEETAVAQFGKDDKYFGVAIMMVTMPGLPMFGHGQVEGFHEKYGMEYRRAKYEEQADGWLIERHYREVFPLMHRRYQFAEVQDFYLYDVHAGSHVNENVFAYSNRVHGAASLVLFNNSYERAEGWINLATPKAGSAQMSLAPALGLEGGDNRYTIFREQISNLWYIRPSNALFQGVEVRLDGYNYQVYLDIYEVTDTDGRYARLNESLGGDGVEDIEKELLQQRLEPVHNLLRPLLNGEMIRQLRGERGQRMQQRALSQAPLHLAALLEGVGAAGLQNVQEVFAAKLARLVALPEIPAELAEEPQRTSLEHHLSTHLTDANSGMVYLALLLDTLEEAGQDLPGLHIEQMLQDTYASAGMTSGRRSSQFLTWVRVYGKDYASLHGDLISRPEFADYLHVNLQNGEFNQSDYGEIVLRALAYALLSASSQQLAALQQGLQDNLDAMTAAGSDWRKMKAVSSPSTPAEKPQRRAERKKAAPAAPKKAKATGAAKASKASKAAKGAENSENTKRREPTNKATKDAENTGKKAPARRKRTVKKSED